jgi:hypothetical protein
MTTTKTPQVAQDWRCDLCEGTGEVVVAEVGYGHGAPPYPVYGVCPVCSGSGVNGPAEEAE